MARMATWRRFTSRTGAVGVALAAALLAGCGSAALQPGPGAGTRLPTLTVVETDNPRLADAGYVRLGGALPKGVTAYGHRHTDGVQLLINAANQVVGVRGVFPLSVGLQTWYDQALPTPATRDAAGTAGGSGSSATPANRAGKGTVATKRSASGSGSAPAGTTPKTGTGKGAGPAGPGASGSTAGAGSAASGATPQAGGSTGEKGTGVSGVHRAAGQGSTAGGSAGLTRGAAGTTGGPSSGTAHWYTQTVWFVAPTAAARPGATAAPGTFAHLLTINPALKSAVRLTGFIPGMGHMEGFHGYSLAVLVGRNGSVIGVAGYFPLNGGYQPMFDQIPGHIDAIPALNLQGYSQQVFFVDPATIR